MASSKSSIDWAIACPDLYIFFPLADYICFGYLAKAVNLKSSTEPGISSGSMGDDDAQTDAPLPATLVRIPAEQREKESE